MSNINEEEYLKAYCKELEYYFNFFKDKKIDTIFFGGGTPSLMSIKFLDSIINKINNLWGIENEIEISMEANPTTVEVKKFEEFKNIGINRLSIGIQSLNDNELKFFGRIHNREEGINAISIANRVFGNRYSIDLIYARPHQKLKDWLLELKEAVKLSPFHISLYQLIIEENTVFYKKNIKSLDDENASILYNETNNFLEKNNLHLYEVSNYSQYGYECKHNINYWDSGEWIGIGTGAHSRLCFDDKFINGYKVRTSIENIKSPKEWVENVIKYGYGYNVYENLSKEEFIEEIILMGLRKKDGINIKNLKNYIDIKNIKEILNKKNIDFLLQNNYIDISENYVRVKTNYFNILDSIIEKLLP